MVFLVAVIFVWKRFGSGVLDVMLHAQHPVREQCKEFWV
jgi:hypothetical protein